MKVGDLVREYYIGNANYKPQIGIVVAHHLTETSEGWHVFFPTLESRPLLMHYANLEVISESR